MGTIRSVGFRTDLMVAGEGTSAVERPDYWVVTTRTNPTFYWGNYLLFKQSPSAASAEKWDRAFVREFGDGPGHRALAWENPTMADPAPSGVVAAFVDRGYEYSVVKVLTANAVRPPKHPCANAVLRPLDGEADWLEQLQLSLDTREEQESLEGYRLFAERRQLAHRRAIAAGRGTWWGAFVDGELRASAGLYWDDTRALGRFQVVATAPGWRRRGLCGTLIHGLSRWGLAERDLAELVMVADEDYHAARVYESVGFRATQRHAELLRRP